MAISDDIINWSIQASMKAAYTGSVSLANAESTYDDTLRATPVEVELQCTALTVNVSGDACWTGDKTWVNGLIGGTDEAEAISERMIQFSLRSYFARLSSRTLNTESAIGNANAALEEIAEEYAGIPTALFSFSAETLSICGPVGGSSILDEMRMVAQAGKAALFVDETGILVAEQWKDASDPVDVTIPDEAIVSAQQSVSSGIPPTRLKIRGCFFSEWERGEQDLQNPGGGDDGPGGGGPGGVTKCIKNGVPQEVADEVINAQNLKGKKPDWQNAALRGLGASPAQIKAINAINETDGIKFQAADGYLGEGDHEHEWQVSGRVRNEEEHGSPLTKYQKSGDDQAKQKREIEAIGDLLQGAPPRHGGPAGGGGRRQSPDKAPMERTEIQYEVTVADPDLVSQYGIKEEGMENPYVPSKSTLFDIAVRRFQEIKMEAKTWQVSTTYLPCLELNQVVQFKTPKLLDGDQQTITGLLTAIQLSYSPDPRVTMTLTVESFEDIGSTDYESSNLIDDPSMDGSDWAAGNTGTGNDGQMGGGELNLYDDVDGGDPSSLPYVEVTVDTVSGEDYELTYTATEHAGTAILWLRKDGIAVAFSSVSETKVYVFTATASTHTFRWGITVNPGATANWTVNQVTLKRTVTA